MPEIDTARLARRADQGGGEILLVELLVPGFGEVSEVAPALADAGIGAIEEEEFRDAFGPGERELVCDERADVMGDERDATDAEPVKVSRRSFASRCGGVPSADRATFDTVRPKPRKSGAIQSKCSASMGRLCIQVRLNSGQPCRKTTGSPRPALT